MVEDQCCSVASATPPDFFQEKRSLRIHGRSTTVRLERMFWSRLEGVAGASQMPVSRLIEILHDRMPHYGASNLASCCRVVCLKLCQGTMRVEDLLGSGPRTNRASSDRRQTAGRSVT